MDLDDADGAVLAQDVTARWPLPSFDSSAMDGTALLRELAAETGLASAVTGALLDTYRGFPVHLPGQVFADLAVAIADGADAVTGIEVLRDREALFGPVASMPTAWRLLDRIDDPHLTRVRAARAAARDRAWAAGAAPDPVGELRIDFDATITITHSEKENAAATWKRTFGFHPLLAFADRPDVASGEALAGLLRPGNAGSNTAADHVTVLGMALAQLPREARPRPGDPTSPRVLPRSDSAGATHLFAAACHTEGVEFSFGFPVDERVQRIVDLIPDRCWHPSVISFHRFLGFHGTETKQRTAGHVPAMVGRSRTRGGRAIERHGQLDTSIVVKPGEVLTYPRRLPAVQAHRPGPPEELARTLRGAKAESDRWEGAAECGDVRAERLNPGDL